MGCLSLSLLSPLFRSHRVLVVVKLSYLSPSHIVLCNNSWSTWASTPLLVLGDMERTRLRGDLDRLRGDFELLRGDFALLFGDFGLLRGDFDFLRGEFELLRGEIELLRGNFDLLRGDFEVLRGDFDLLRGDCDRSLEDLERFCGDAERGESERFLSNDATLLRGDLGRPRGDLERSLGDLARRGGDAERLERKRLLVLLRDSFGGEDGGGVRYRMFPLPRRILPELEILVFLEVCSGGALYPAVGKLLVLFFASSSLFFLIGEGVRLLLNRKELLGTSGTSSAATVLTGSGICSDLSLPELSLIFLVFLSFIFFFFCFLSAEAFLCLSLFSFLVRFFF